MSVAEPSDTRVLVVAKTDCAIAVSTAWPDPVDVRAVHDPSGSRLASVTSDVMALGPDGVGDPSTGCLQLPSNRPAAIGACWAEPRSARIVRGFLSRLADREAPVWRVNRRSPMRVVARRVGDSFLADADAGAVVDVVMAVAGFDMNSDLPRAYAISWRDGRTQVDEVLPGSTGTTVFGPVVAFTGSPDEMARMETGSHTTKDGASARVLAHADQLARATLKETTGYTAATSTVALWGRRNRVTLRHSSGSGASETEGSRVPLDYRAPSLAAGLVERVLDSAQPELLRVAAAHDMEIVRVENVTGDGNGLIEARIWVRRNGSHLAEPTPVSAYVALEAGTYTDDDHDWMVTDLVNDWPTWLRFHTMSD